MPEKCSSYCFVPGPLKSVVKGHWSTDALLIVLCKWVSSRLQLVTGIIYIHLASNIFILYFSFSITSQEKIPWYDFYIQCQHLYMDGNIQNLVRVCGWFNLSGSYRTAPDVRSYISKFLGDILKDLRSQKKCWKKVLKNLRPSDTLQVRRMGYKIQCVLCLMYFSHSALKIISNLLATEFKPLCQCKLLPEQYKVALVQNEKMTLFFEILFQASL